MKNSAKYFGPAVGPKVR